MLIFAALLLTLWASPLAGIIAIVWVAIMAARATDDALQDGQYIDNRDHDDD